jgi:hypothetical protein
LIGRLLKRLPAAIRVAYFVASASFLFVYSWMWAKGYVLV